MHTVLIITLPLACPGPLGLLPAEARVEVLREHLLVACSGLGSMVPWRPAYARQIPHILNVTQRKGDKQFSLRVAIFHERGRWGKTKNVP